MRVSHRDHGRKDEELACDNLRNNELVVTTAFATVVYLTGVYKKGHRLDS